LIDPTRIDTLVDAYEHKIAAQTPGFLLFRVDSSRQNAVWMRPSEHIHGSAFGLISVL
jgi:hypothetical protein